MIVAEAGNRIEDMPEDLYDMFQPGTKKKGFSIDRLYLNNELHRRRISF